MLVGYGEDWPEDVGSTDFRAIEPGATAVERAEPDTDGSGHHEAR
jgi:hypothetical protein